VAANAHSGDVTLSIRLGVDGPEEPVPADLTSGRADVYRRNVVLGGPFVIWAGDRRTLAPRLIAWIAHP
jgi:hypothetical protein